MTPSHNNVHFIPGEAKVFHCINHHSGEIGAWSFHSLTVSCKENHYIFPSKTIVNILQPKTMRNHPVIKLAEIIIAVRNNTDWEGGEDRVGQEEDRKRRGRGRRGRKEKK